MNTFKNLQKPLNKCQMPNFCCWLDQALPWSSGVDDFTRVRFSFMSLLRHLSATHSSWATSCTFIGYFECRTIKLSLSHERSANPIVLIGVCYVYRLQLKLVLIKVLVKKKKLVWPFIIICKTAIQELILLKFMKVC